MPVETNIGMFLTFDKEVNWLTWRPFPFSEYLTPSPCSFSSAHSLGLNYIHDVTMNMAEYIYK